MEKNDKKGTRPETREAAAVVGLGLSLPGAATPDEFWANILAGKRFFQPATALDWGAEPELFYQPGGPAPDKAYSLNGVFNPERRVDPEGLDLPDDFDPKSADGSLAYWLLAGQRAASGVKWEKVDKTKVGVISGHVILPTTAMAEAAVSLYAGEATREWKNRPQLMPPPKNAFRVMGYSARLLARALGFSGPAYTLDAACASSLYAVHLAVEELLSGRAEAVISGGVAKADALFTQLGFSQLRALSANGFLNPFDQSADGLVVGEGAVALVLKRLDTALAHGDEVMAVIRSVGLSNDQSGNILAPQTEGQLRAMRSAFRGAGLSPSSLGLIEAHGTGTILGDQVETAALKELLGDSPEGSGPGMVPVLGSVKSNIGHLLSAAGAAALAKVVLAIRHKTLPPTAGFVNEAGGLALSDAPALRVLTTPEAWPAPPDGSARLAAVNAFGFGGVNAQALVEEFIREQWEDAAPDATASRPEIETPDKSAGLQKIEAPDKLTGLQKKTPPVRLLAARALSAPWPDFASLAQNWMDSEGPPIIATRRFGSLRATGLFFNQLTLEGANMRLAPKDLGNILPQQALALKMTGEALSEARLSAAHGSEYITAKDAVAAKDANPDAPAGVHKSRVGVFMGVDIDPRSADYAFRWLGPLRAAEALVVAGDLRERDVPEFIAALRKKSPPALTASRVIGALGSLVASRVARFLGSGGPAFTVSEENMSGLRALKTAMGAIGRGEIDLAFVGLVDTMGDPKTAALEPRRLWEEGAAMLILASPEAARNLGRAQAPELEEVGEVDGRIGGLGGLFPLVKNAFFIRHRLVSRGLGAGAAYWIKNRSDPPRSLSSPGFLITEKGGEEVVSPPYSYEDATWFLVRSQNAEDSLRLLERLEDMAIEAMEDHSLVEVLGPARSEKRSLKRVSDHFWSSCGKARGARPALAIMARTFDELLLQIKRAKSRLRGQPKQQAEGHKGRVIWAHEGERVKGELAWVFPGSGSRYQGLGRRLAMRFPHLMGKLEDGVERLADHFQSNVFWAQSHREPSPLQGILGQVSFGHLGALVLSQFNILPQAVIGYSLGETTALMATGAWPEREKLYEDFVKSPLFTRELAGEYRAARRLWNWPEGRPFRWAAGVLPCPAEDIQKALEKLPSIHRGHAFLLIKNTKNEGVVGGEEAAVKALAHSLGAVLCPLDGVASVHCPVAEPLADEYRRFHTRPTIAPGGMRFYSPAFGRAYELNSESAANSLTEQALRGHDFARVIEEAYKDGVRFFVEVGPGSGCTRMIDSILAGKPHLAAALAAGPQDEGWMGLNRLFVELWMAGYPFKKTSVLYPEEGGGPPSLPVEIKLAPAYEMWPEPEDILAEAAAAPPSQESPPERKKDGSAPPALDEKAGDKAFADWLSANKKQREEKEAALRAESPAPLSRQQCLEFAVGKIGKVFGPRFSPADAFPSRVRLPDEPLMLVDRVLSLSGQALSMGAGEIVTEHDVKEKAWYLERGRIPTGLAIESGQADLMLSAWLGADFVTKGLALYRLLDAEVTFHRRLPRAGETVRYDIKISRFFKYGQTHLFRFEFEGTIEGRPVLTMKGGCAGFFTKAELAGGRGLPGGGLTEDPLPAKLDPAAASFRNRLPEALDRAALEALREGKLAEAFGADFRPALQKPMRLPGGKMALLGRAVKIQSRGGRYGAGFIRTELDIDPGAWFLTSHFVGDEVMPGTLMYESCLQSLSLFLMASGWVGEEDAADWQPIAGAAASLKCRGQVTGLTKTAAYEIHVRRLEFVAPPDGGEPEPAAFAEAIMLADDRPIVEVRNMNLRLAGSSRAALEALWSGSPRTPLRRRVLPQTPPEALRFFDKARLTALAEGKPSEALGRAYARFDDGAFVARLPRAPYDFIDEARVENSPPYEVRVGAEVSAVYNVKREGRLLEEAGGAEACLPYAALNEIALQPCGFLAAYMGSALPFNGPMHFRNLGGRATLHARLSGGERVETTARLTRESRMGDMLIQHYEFACRSGRRVVYEGQTHFGFFSPEALANQAGLTSEKAPAFPDRRLFRPFPENSEGGLWPSGRWRMLDEIALDLQGGPRGLGAAFARTKVDPQAWFFQAHFLDDPVWPGSLGLEAFLQAAKALAAEKFGWSGNDLSWDAPQKGRPHEWLYRGQITPVREEMSVALTVAESGPGSLVCDGLLLVDGLPIYKMTGFTAALAEAAPRPLRRRILRGEAGAAEISPDRLLAWRKEQGLSQGQLAKLMGVTPIYISLMERGKRNISPLMAEKLGLIFSGGVEMAREASDRESEILSRGTLKSRREKKAAAAKLLNAEQLRDMRLERGLSQKRLADQVGVTATLIGLIELGKRGLSLELAQKILAVLESDS